MKWYRSVLFLGLLLSCIFLDRTAVAGQRAAVEESPMDGMTIEEMRAYQSYLYVSGKRDPMLMRFPTSAELRINEPPQKKVPTRDEQRQELEQAIKSLVELVRSQKYLDAIQVAEDILIVIEDWPAFKPEDVDLLNMVDEIRSFYRMAVTLKRNQDIKNEFTALNLKVNGVVWSPTDAKAVVNGVLYSAGEVMVSERKQGDLRIEIIEEHGVIFQFKGIRFRLPVEIYAPANSGTL